MKELDFLEIINRKLSVNSYLGDDCAYLDDLDIFVTHDTLAENVHFSLYTISPYLLGRKSVAVNLSDLAASLALPKYITISLSLPSNIKNEFVEEFYQGVNDICNEYNVKVIGGDLTASEKVVVSVCAIGKKHSLYLSSRSNAKKGDYVVVTGYHGSSAAGFYALDNFLYADKELIDAHLNPVPKIAESYQLANITDNNITVMDSSDGLLDALYKIAAASKHSIEIDINKVPVSEKLIEFCTQNNLNYKKFVKWGGEDYQLVACVPEEICSKLDKTKFTVIGKVINKDLSPCVIVKDFDKTEKVTKDVFSEEVYKHFS